MRRIILSIIAALAAAGSVGVLLSAQAAAPAAQSPIVFARDIQPILEQNCLSCHGEALQLWKFDLRTRESALRGGEHGSDIVPGSAEQSRMYRRVAGLEKPSMPAQGTPLTADQIAAVKKWIDAGAVWEAATPGAT